MELSLPPPLFPILFLLISLPHPLQPLLPFFLLHLPPPTVPLLGCKIGQQVSMLAIKPEDLSLILGTHTVEGENHVPQVF